MQGHAADGTAPAVAQRSHIPSPSPSDASRTCHLSPATSHTLSHIACHPFLQTEFFNVDEMETMATAEHFMATDVDWDPTGRYVATSVTSIHQMDNGFKVWSFNGRLLYEAPKDRLFQLSWRPRLPSLLPPEKEAEIVKNLKQYTKRYDEEDEALVRTADEDVLAERRQLMDEWQRFLEKKREAVAMQEGFRKQMFGARWVEQESRMEKRLVEQTLEVKEEPMQAS